MTPLLPLDTFREIAGFNPFHFWQLTNSIAPLTSKCNSLVYRYSYQNVDAEGRKDIQDAIETAEQRLEEYLGYSVAPKYKEQTLPFPTYLSHSQSYRASWGSDGRWLSVGLMDGYVQNVGVETLSLIGTATVTYSDADSDGLDDTFTCSIATAITDPTEIAAYFKASDRLDGESAGAQWRIEPVQVTISAGVATIRGRAWLLVRPVLYEGVAPAHLNPSTTANFATELEIYRRYTNGDGTTDETAQGLLTWETEPAGWLLGCCSSIVTDPADSSLDPAAIATAIARVGIRDARRGIVIPAQSSYNVLSGIWTSINWSACSPPDTVTIRYLAGYDLEGGAMAKKWQTIVARLAMAELDAPICACQSANKTIHRWQLDLARTGGNNDEQFGAISAADLDNPFGTRRGHVYAWRQVRNLRQLTGFLPG